MASQKSRSNRHVPLLSLAAILLVSPFVPANARAIEGQHWLVLAPTQSSLPAAQNAVKRLDAGMQDDAKICINEGQYEVVHSQNGTIKDILDLKAQLGATWASGKIIQLPANQCFSMKHFLQANAVATPQPRTEPPTRPSGSNRTPSDPKVVKAGEPTPMQNHTTLSTPHVDHVPVRIDLPKNFGMTMAKAKVVKDAPTQKAVPLENTFVQVRPEVTTRILLSNRDVNRITCMGGRPVKDVVFSNEKGVTTKIEGSNVFVKFQVRQESMTEKVEFIEHDTELYVVCGKDSEIYSLVTKPSAIPAQTVQLLDTEKKRVEQNVSLFQGMSFEKQILTIMKQAYTGEYPASYEIDLVGRTFNVFEKSGVQVELVRVVNVTGEGLRVKEYDLRLLPQHDNGEIQVMEKYFLVPELAEKPVGITLDSLSVTKDTTTRLFIIERPAEKAA